MCSLHLGPLPLAEVWTLFVGGQGYLGKRNSKHRKHGSIIVFRTSYYTVEAAMEEKEDLNPCYLSILSNNCVRQTEIAMGTGIII